MSAWSSLPYGGADESLHFAAFLGFRLGGDGSVPLLGAPSLLGALTSRSTIARATQCFWGQIFTS